LLFLISKLCILIDKIKTQQRFLLQLIFYSLEFHGDRNIFQELAEKDHYLMLAAEAGQVLLEKNQELSEQYSRLQEDYLHKIEVFILVENVFTSLQSP